MGIEMNENTRVKTYMFCIGNRAFQIGNLATFMSCDKKYSIF